MKRQTYNKDDFKLPMDTVVSEPYKYIQTGLPDSAYANGKNWRMTPELPFWWFLNPWKTCEELQLSLFRAVDAHRKDSAERDGATDKLNAEWSKEYRTTSEALQQVRDKVYDLENELATVKAERDAANDAVRTLRKKGRRRG